MKNESLEDLVTENIVKKAYGKEMDKIAVSYGSIIKGIDRAKGGVGAALAVGSAGYFAGKYPDRIKKGLESVKKTLSDIGKELTGKAGEGKATLAQNKKDKVKVVNDLKAKNKEKTVSIKNNISKGTKGE